MDACKQIAARPRRCGAPLSAIAMRLVYTSLLGRCLRLVGGFTLFVGASATWTGSVVISLSLNGCLPAAQRAHEPARIAAVEHDPKCRTVLVGAQPEERW